MGLKINKIIPVLFSLIIFCFSIFLFEFFTGGDQKFYRHYYSEVAQMGFVDGFLFYKNALSTSEPGYFILTYFSSKFLDKDILLSLINAVFVFYIFLFLNSKKVSYAIQILLLFNFYLVVLLFSAERLKISLFILLISFSYSGIPSVALKLLSFFTHVQTLILIVQPFIVNFLNFSNEVALSKKRVFSSIAVIFFLCLALFLMKDHIFEKISHYEGDIYSTFKPIVFMIFSILCTEKRKIIPFFQSMLFVIISYFLGEERIVIFSYIVFMYYGLQFKRGKNIYVVTTSIYFSTKGIIFLLNIFNFGDGFNSENHIE